MKLSDLKFYTYLDYDLTGHNVCVVRRLIEDKSYICKTVYCARCELFSLVNIYKLCRKCK